MRFFIFVINLLIIIFTTPAFASGNLSTTSGLSPKIQFVGHSSRTLNIMYAPSSMFTSADDTYDFVPTNGDWNAANYTNSGSAYSYSAVAPVQTTSGTDVASWITAVNTDPTILALSGTNQALINTMETTVALNQNNPTLCRTTWSTFVATNGLTWCTTTIQTIIINYAVKYKVPIV